MSETLDDLEDFEIPEISYEIWAIGYDRKEVQTGFELLLGSFVDPDKAIEAAKNIVLSDILSSAGAAGCYYFKVEVETTVNVDQDETTSVGTVYRRSIENTNPVVSTQLHYSDYELTEAGDLILKRSHVGELECGDYLSIVTGDDNETATILLKVKEKLDNSLICEFID